MMRTLGIWMTVVAVVATATGASAGEWWIPAAAHGPGAGGSVWRTDLVVSNFGDGAEEVTITLLPQGEDNSAAGNATTIPIGAGETVELEDVVAGTFNFDGTAAIRVGAVGDRLVVTSRTYNLSDHGTFGQSIPGVPAAGAVPAGIPGLLVGLSSSEGRRTNLGWASASADPVRLTVSLYDGAGVLVAARTFTEQPLGQTQFNLFRELGVGVVDHAYAVVVADGPVVPYASVVAGGSNDPVYVPALTGVDADTELLFPAAAHVAGSGGTSWGSDAWLLNLGGGAATVELELWPTGGGAPVAVQLDPALAPGGQASLEDLVLSAFGLDDAQGALLVRSDQLLLATSRTYNDAAIGEFGQFIPARSTAAMPGVGERLLLPGAVQNAAFRTNLGLVAVNGDAEVELLLRAADGSVLATSEASLAAGRQMQSRVGTFFGVAGFDGASVEVELAAHSDPEARIAGYLSVVDNLSTDPTFSDAARGVGADPGTDAISQAVLATTYALGRVVGVSGPQAVKAASVDCLDVEYTGDTVRPGQSPDGACWQVAATFDQCGVTLPNAGWALTQDGTAGVDVCVVDGYPSTLHADLVTIVEDLTTGETFRSELATVLQLVLTFDGSLPASAHLTGELALDADGAEIEAWADLEWQSALVSFELIPTGQLRLEFPYETDISATAEVLATFDGTEWVLVQVRLGYFRASFYVNMFTGQVLPA